MDILQILLLASVQGLAEFLPISSSGHLILAPWLFGYELQSLSFDVAVHLGTLGAVMLYFRREVAGMTLAVLGSLRTRRLATPEARLGWTIVIATLPVIVLGMPLKALIEVLRADPQRIALVVAGTTIGFGLLLGWADWRGRRVREQPRLVWHEALFVGLCQTLAIIPGTSRSGITITAGLLLGLTRRAAARFSFLLSIPTILMAGGLETLDLVQSETPVDWGALLLGIGLSFGIAWPTIHFFLKLIERIGMWPFVVYRLLLGTLILMLLLVR